MKPSLVLALVVGLALAGCSSSEGGGDGGDASGGSGGNAGSQSGGDGEGSGDGDGAGDAYGTCCIGDGKYRCDTEEAFDQCTGFDMDACMGGCGEGDFACQDGCFQQMQQAEPDPSACVEDDSVECDGSGSSGSGSGANCDDACCTTGEVCDFDSDCCDDKCIDNLCYGRGGGSQCDFDDDCDSGACDDGFCQ